MRLVHTANDQGVSELATVVRSITDLRQVMGDAAARQIAVTGPAEPVALAEWLVRKLDQPLNASRTTRQFPQPGDSVRIYFLPVTITPQQMQEWATIVRSLGDIPRLMTDGTHRALVMRATAGQQALAEWLIAALQRSTTSRFLWQEGGREREARVLRVTSSRTPQDTQEIATALRSIGDLRRLMAASPPGLLALRGTAEQVAFAEWLIGRFEEGGPGNNEFTLAGAAEGSVRVFFFAQPKSTQQLQEVAVRVRQESQARRLITNTARLALVVRGTAEQVARAAELAHELDR